MDKEFQILVLGALNWLFCAEGAKPEVDSEFLKYYTEDWLPRQRKLIDALKVPQ